MMTTNLPALIVGADRTFTYEQFRTWVVAQSVRNALETYHGDWAYDPDNPGSGAGFISDDQMRALNITIRRAVHEALGQVDLACNTAKRSHRGGPCSGEQAALEFCEFQLRTIRDYMEAPGSPELEEAYRRHVRDPDVNR